MSFTIGRSYGTGRNYKVPNYYVNSQNMQSPGTTTPRTGTSIPGGGTTPTTPGMTPGSGTAPTTPSMTPGSRTTPTTPGMAPGSGTTPTAPSMTPGSGTTPTAPGMTPGSRTTPGMSPATPGMTPGSSTAPTTPGMTPGSGTTPTTPGMTPGSSTTPTTPGSGMTPATSGMTPGSSMTPATPGLTPGSSTAPARFRNITTPPASDTGSGTAPGTSGTMPESRPGIMPRLVPSTPGPATSTPSGTSGMMPGTTSQELPYFIGAPTEQEDMDMNMPEYMYPNMPYGNPGSNMQPSMPFAPQAPQAPGMPFAPQPTQAPGMPFAPLPSSYPYNQPMPYGIGEMPSMEFPSYQKFPNMYLPNANYGTPMGVPLFPLYGYDNSMDLDRDMDYMKHLYPDTAKQIQSEIDKECDQMEYDGSVMFDEYPDKVYLERVMERIYDKVKNIDEEPQLEAQSLYFFPVRKRNDFLHDLVSILLLNEIFNRRRHRRARNRWY